MPKLRAPDRFYDFSDYGRPVARCIAVVCRDTPIHAVHMTWAFLTCGLVAIACLMTDRIWLAAGLLVLKSILDAADGELARIQQRPSYVGRYLDSVFDFLLNLLLLAAICMKTAGSWPLALLAFLCMELQGSQYNYYYTIQRHKLAGDTTSRVEEDHPPVAYAYESQVWVDRLFYIFIAMYRPFDRLVLWLDPDARQLPNLPKWFLSLLSLYGLGFQLLLIGVFAVSHQLVLVLPFLSGYTLLMFIFITIRRCGIRPTNLVKTDRIATE